MDLAFANADSEDSWISCFLTEQDLRGEEKVVIKEVVKEVVKEIPRTNLEWEDVTGHDVEVPDDSDDKPCVICMINVPRCVLFPCMHAGLCISCANAVKKSKSCPLCRKRVDTPKILYSQ